MRASRRTRSRTVWGRRQWLVARDWRVPERLWGVLQDRFTGELRLVKADRRDSANAVLRQFITRYNCRFARQSRESQPAWRPAPENLERICCFVHERIVSNDNVVQWEGRRFQIPQQARRFTFAGAKVSRGWRGQVLAMVRNMG